MNEHGFKHLLRNGGFQAFLWTQFLGAFNDNVYKIVVSMRAVHLAANSGSSSLYLSLAGAVFVIPSLLFTGYSGHLADAVSKRSVLVGVKAFEIFAMACGLAAFLTTSVPWMLFVLFLMALHSTVFGPAKYAIVPEMLPEADLSRANALLEMSTFVAIVAGTSIGTFLFTAWKEAPWRMGAAMIAIAIAGFAASLRITRVPAPAAPGEPFRRSPFAEIAEGTRRLLADRPMWLTVLGISYFWMLGALLQLDLILFGSETLHADDLHVGLLVTFLAIGIGAGSLLAGKLSGDKIELGIVPLGAIFMGLSSVALYAARGSYAASAVALAFLGCSGGLYIVPLNAFLQQRAGGGEKGRAIATNNFYNTIGLLLAAGLLWLLHDYLRLGPDRIILIFGFVTLAVAVYICVAVNDFLIRFVLWMLTHTVYRIRIEGAANVPRRGPALLVSNHVSYIDGLLIGACLPRFVRFMVLKQIYDLPALNWFFRKIKAIPVDQTHRRGMVEALRAARLQLAEGRVVCIFAEGTITRTGNLGPFRRGLERIVDGMNVPVIPVHLDRVWGSVFSFAGGKFFWKLPKRVPYPVTVSFGPPLGAAGGLAAGAQAHEVRSAIQELACNAVALRKTPHDTLGRRFIRNARRNWNGFAMADSTGRELTNGRALTAAEVVSQWARRETRPEEMVGVLLPASAAGALANIGLTLAGRIPVNLNFTTGREAMESAVAQCGIRTVVTSKIFLAKAKLEAPAGAVFVEEIFGRATRWQKLCALLAARFAPVFILDRGRCGPDSTATVIFSSGSTGVPKGVVLTHYNVIANIEAIAQVFPVTKSDRVAGSLPFFHSFGFTVTIWFPPLAGCGAIYHANPTDTKAIGGWIAKYRGTLLLSTPTFCSMYARKCSREEFASLRYVLVGAEKLREPIAAAFRERFGLELMEGYGCTEMSPVVAVNAPDFADSRELQTATKPGTVGHPLPGVAAKIVHPATYEPMPHGGEGLLLVKGQNRMARYLNQPERTAEATHDGWYVTGDIATIDDEGFLRITDRLSRFSKIGGEMVPHLKVEEAIAAQIGDVPCCVTAVADEKRGERLVALYVHAELEPDVLWRRLSETELPKLWIPKREDIVRVDAIPLLGTGKVDLRAVRELAANVAAL
jgi:acyl-[acyl-carrier-protein]-phospholipid O-acyltransferase / long-chain-fatty-acid--[acyl-carrier-protein] ligase